MATFRYKALTESGGRTDGVLTAGSKQAALTDLESRRLAPIEVREEAAPSSSSGISRFGRGISKRQLATAYTQIGDLLRAGVPLLRCLRLLGKQRANPLLAAIFTQVADEVEDGAELAHALETRPEVFPRIQVAMIRAAEKGGFLEQVCSRMGAFLTAQADLRAKILSNLLYPAVLVMGMVFVCGLIFGIYVPRLRGLLESQTLPFVTRFVFFLSDLVTTYGLVVLGAAVAGAVILWRAARRPRVREHLARWQLGMPVLGPLLTAIVVARFCRILGTLLNNAIPVVTAMQISREAAGNWHMERAIDEAAECVRRGESVAAPLDRSGLFPPDVIEMISVGESANNLDEVLLTAADTLERRIDRISTAAVKLIEPCLIVCIALVVFVVAMAVVVPLSQMSQQAR